MEQCLSLLPLLSNHGLVSLVNVFRLLTVLLCQPLTELAIGTEGKSASKFFFCILFEKHGSKGNEGNETFGIGSVDLVLEILKWSDVVKSENQYLDRLKQRYFNELRDLFFFSKSLELVITNCFMILLQVSYIRKSNFSG